MSGINGDWYEALKGEFKKPYYKTLFNTVNEEYRTRQIFPPANDIFNAFHLTPLKDVKVVILGQDPYHNFNQAHGLCFSVKKGVQVPPSLVNIYKELQDDLGCTIPNQSAGRSLQMQRSWQSTHRTVRSYSSYGERRHSGKNECSIIRSI